MLSDDEAHHVTPRRPNEWLAAPPSCSHWTSAMLTNRSGRRRSSIEKTLAGEALT
jgi:hypothetical protein